MSRGPRTLETFNNGPNRVFTRRKVVGFHLYNNLSFRSIRTLAWRYRTDKASEISGLSPDKASEIKWPFPGQVTALK